MKAGVWAGAVRPVRPLWPWLAGVGTVLVASAALDSAAACCHMDGSVRVHALTY